MMSSAGKLGVALLTLSLCAQAHDSNKGKRHRHRRGWVDTAEVLEQYGGPDSGTAESSSSGVQTCELVGSCPVTGMPGGLAWDGTHYWYADFFAPTLHRVDPVTYAIVRSIPAPGTFIGGLAWDGSSLWCAPEQAGELYRLDPQDGSVMQVIPAPSFGSADPNGSGLAWDGTALWHADYGTRQLYRLDPASGQVLSQLTAPGSMPTGLGYDAGVLYLADPVTDETYAIDATDGALLSTCPAPDGQIWGVTVDGAGNMLSAGWNTRSIYTTGTGAEVEDEEPWENFCQSTTNSTGSAATLAAGGSTSVEANDLVLYASPVPDRVGVFIYGPNQTERPFGNGFLCVGGPRYRLGVTRGVGNVMAMPVEPGHLRCRDNFTVGAVWNFQTWFREGKYGRDRGFNTSDGLSLTLEP